MTSIASDDVTDETREIVLQTLQELSEHHSAPLRIALNVSQGAFPIISVIINILLSESQVKHSEAVPMTISKKRSAKASHHCSRMSKVYIRIQASVR